ncbi:response regulator transcription factor [Streptomyces sp. NPDC001315]|uniref:response regulator transcription factor n=1 Tax=Streptomyces sp. NPDC001315 TaxID=3364562 RepID=UPI003677D944
MVENNRSEAEALTVGLRRHGHDVADVATGVEALQVYEGYDLVLLDLELPDVDGLEVCSTIRAACDVPLIAVTARDGELDRVLGLKAGADDYIAKPYSFQELMARMDAVMRRARPRAATSLSHGGLRIDTRAREVRLHDRHVEVTRKEFDLLSCLAASPDAVISRQELMRRVWGDSWSRRTVDTHINSLRNKLGASDWITTVRGVGFRFEPGRMQAARRPAE